MDWNHEQIAAIAGLIVAFSGFMTTLGAVLGSWISGKNKAKRSELAELRARVMDLMKESQGMYNQIIDLRNENIKLHGILEEKERLAQEQASEIKHLQGEVLRLSTELKRLEKKTGPLPDVP